MKGIEKYISILESEEAELNFKKSRFIACLFPIETEAELQDQRMLVREKYPKATHYCYAAIGGEKKRWEKMSDDGEPSGTAGRPILDVLRGSGMTNILAVVVRYFGGTLLGTGGLVRAYSDTTKEVVNQAKRVWMYPAAALKVYMDYGYYNQFESKCRSKLIGKTDVDFFEQVHIKMYVPLEEKEAFIEQLKKITLRTVHIEELGNQYIPIPMS